jgi:O-antigen/teichoic acid export membrane protein
VTILYSIVHFYVLYRRALKRLGLVSGGGTSATAVSPVLEKDAVQSVAKPLDFNLWRYLLRAAWPLAVVAAGVVVYAGLDIPLIAWIKGDKAVGLYNAGAMYYKAVTFLLIAINMAILPAISIVADKHPERLGEVWERLLRYVLILVIPLSVVVPVLARPILIMQKHDYIQVWNVVWITMAAVNFTILTTISYLFFIVIDKQKKIVQVVLIGLAFKTGLNVFLISIWGYTGAAITVLVTEFLAFGLVYYLLSRELKHKISLVRLTGVPAVALAALYALAFLFQKLFISGKAFEHAALGTIPYSLLITVIIVLIYGAVAFSSRTVTRAGIAELNELLKVE